MLFCQLLVLTALVHDTLCRTINVYSAICPPGLTLYTVGKDGFAREYTGNDEDHTLEIPDLVKYVSQVVRDFSGKNSLADAESALQMRGPNKGKNVGSRDSVFVVVIPCNTCKDPASVTGPCPPNKDVENVAGPCPPNKDVENVAGPCTPNKDVENVVGPCPPNKDVENVADEDPPINVAEIVNAEGTTTDIPKKENAEGTTTDITKKENDATTESDNSKNEMDTTTESDNSNNEKDTTNESDNSNNEKDTTTESDNSNNEKDTTTESDISNNEKDTTTESDNSNNEKDTTTTTTESDSSKNEKHTTTTTTESDSSKNEKHIPKHHCCLRGRGAKGPHYCQNMRGKTNLTCCQRAVGKTKSRCCQNSRGKSMSRGCQNRPGKPQRGIQNRPGKPQLGIQNRPGKPEPRGIQNRPDKTKCGGIRPCQQCPGGRIRPGSPPPNWGGNDYYTQEDNSSCSSQRNTINFNNLVIGDLRSGLTKKTNIYRTKTNGTAIFDFTMLIVAITDLVLKVKDVAIQETTKTVINLFGNEVIKKNIKPCHLTLIANYVRGLVLKMNVTASDKKKVTNFADLLHQKGIKHRVKSSPYQLIQQDFKSGSSSNAVNINGKEDNKLLALYGPLKLDTHKIPGLKYCAAKIHVTGKKFDRMYIKYSKNAT